jgi:hypothetical protein
VSGPPDGPDEFSVVFQEVISELQAEHGWTAEEALRVRQTTALHEVGHQFNLSHHLTNVPETVMWAPGPGLENSMKVMPQGFAEFQFERILNDFKVWQ